MGGTIACTVEGQTHTNSTVGSFSKSADGYVGKSGNYYYTFFMKFTVPEYTGVPHRMEFGLFISGGTQGTQTFRAALSGSEENLGDYISSHEPLGTVTEDNQIAAGEAVFAQMTANPQQYTFSLDGSRILPGGTYYLILWAPEAIGAVIQPVNSTYGSAEAALICFDGLTRLDVGDGIVPAVACIGSAGGYLQAIPYVDTGTEWKLGT